MWAAAGAATMWAFWQSVLAPGERNVHVCSDGDSMLA